MGQKTMGTSKRSKLFAASSMFSVASALFFSIEFQAFDDTHANSLGREIRIDPLATLPLSHRARLDTLRWCDQELSAPLSMVKTGQLLEQDASICLSIAGKILSQSPSFGFAYLVAARSHAQLGQPEMARAALTKSAALAPFEGWQIQRRLKLSLEVSAAPDQITNDISALLTTQSGAELIVKHYISGNEVRKFVNDGLRLVAKTDQTRFFSLLRKFSARS